MVKNAKANVDAPRVEGKGNNNLPLTPNKRPDPKVAEVKPGNADKPNHNLPDQSSLHQIRSSFNDLVIYNEQGQPYLDVNRLVYKPKKKKHKKEKEKLSWYLPDYTFIIFNFLTLLYATYYFINGLTILSWRNSMQQFVIANCSSGSSQDVKICNIIDSQYGDESPFPFTILRFGELDDPSKEGMMLMAFGTINVANVILAIYACLKGNKQLLIWHLLIDLALLISEAITITVMKSNGYCDRKDLEIISAFLQRHVENYGQNVPLRDKVKNEAVKKDTIALDLIQISLSCCGVGNWTDYLPRSTWSPSGELLESSVLTRSNLDKSDMIIPPSCCRMWWVRNIYCAHSAHLWAYPTVTDLQAHQLRQRISQYGCLPKMYGLCKNMVIMAGRGALVACGLHFAFSIVRAICAVVQIQTISTLVRERKRIFRDKERENDYVDVIDDDEEDVYPSLSTIFDEDVSETDAEMSVATRRSALPNPPKEEDIIRMKSRRHISRLTARMKNTHVEKWLAASHAFVEGNDVGTTNKIHVYDNLPKKKRTELTRQKEIMKIQEDMHAADDNYVESEMTKSLIRVEQGTSPKSVHPDVVETLKLLQMHHDKGAGT
ncbi:Sperm flagellar protein 2 [Orchesella cincta]|uniref:Sperm flagellar protein 2 n=1 Tax=Orchesella cincta TaxID=48709 RepID=A0A1D2NA03_ORCCI|nr:Sperm flagellar protein 2 [Orchesella cincta]